MTRAELAGKIDLTLLSPVATELNIASLVADGLNYRFASVCVPPCHVALARSIIRDNPLKITAVTGFPLGFSSADSKLFESVEAAGCGASEIDMVMNVSLFKSGRTSAVEKEIRRVVEALPGAVIKVIIEACYLTDQEKRLALELSVNAGARFVKTSTGWGPGGARVEDIRLLHDAAQGRILLKASGGIKTTGDALEMIGAGADRVGSSSGVAIVEGFYG
ncbi:MAG: deoxyribose-phosphate aldolase [Deltaproteobacteria bacterium]|nr:deoxyribose-phosphate aldolase [Deltaproteobacteria bacterium]